MYSHIPEFSGLKDLPSLFAVTPVSYTHLDVYKRQTISGLVGQLVVVTECFACVTCTDASGYINLFRNDVVPNLVYRFDVAAVSGDGCHICHA